MRRVLLSIGLLLIVPPALLVPSALLDRLAVGAEPDQTTSGPVAAGDRSALRPCTYEQVTPGETRLDEVLERLGEPDHESESDGERTLTFRREPFSRVDVVLRNEVVVSVVLHLSEPAAARQLAKELQLDSFEPAAVFSETGQLLGKAYPERGVMFHLAPGSNGIKVSQLVLEPVFAEAFVLRVRGDRRQRYEQNLADLNTALQLDPAHVDALFWKARLLAAVGQPTQALETAERALQVAPGDARFRLQRAELLFQLERHDEATTIVRDIAQDPGADPLFKARAECLWGTFLSEGPEHDWAQAIQHHLGAIKAAGPLASHRDVNRRREAKAAMLDAFFGATHDIAAGRWQQKPETAAKWLGSARELAEAMISQDGGDELLRLRLWQVTLAMHADLQSDIDPNQTLASVDREIKQLVSNSGDVLFEQSLAFWRAKALGDAATIEQGREARSKAVQYAREAVEAVEPLVNQRELLPAERLLLGKLYFFIGSSQAVLEQQHRQAVQWYEKALPYLGDTLPPSAARELGRHGERFVSIGASYWEVGEQEMALKMTRRGLEMMQQAAKRGDLPADQLSLPYENLAAMYKSLGKTEESRNFAEAAERVVDSRTTAPLRR